MWWRFWLGNRETLAGSVIVTCFWCDVLFTRLRITWLDSSLTWWFIIEITLRDPSIFHPLFRWSCSLTTLNGRRKILLSLQKLFIMVLWKIWGILRIQMVIIILWRIQEGKFMMIRFLRRKLLRRLACLLLGEVLLLLHMLMWSHFLIMCFRSFLHITRSRRITSWLILMRLLILAKRIEWRWRNKFKLKKDT